jgi:hypothetical protein
VKSLKRAEGLLFVPAVLCVFLILDLLLAQVLPAYFISSGRVSLNDYEITQRDHPEETWDKVFYGNSALTSAYREDESTSGYVNLGLRDGTVTGLLTMLQKGYVSIGSELVLGLSDQTLRDEAAPAQEYGWQRAWYQPYCYFHRDRLKGLLEADVRQVLLGEEPAATTQEKTVYHGAMSTEKLLTQWTGGEDQDASAYSENLQALEQIFSYCQDQNIRLRLVWMPENPDLPEHTETAYELTRQFAEQQGVELYDMTGLLEGDCFYDGEHLNYEYGSHVFTEVIDQWLEE